MYWISKETGTGESGKEVDELTRYLLIVPETLQFLLHAREASCRFSTFFLQELIVQVTIDWGCLCVRFENDRTISFIPPDGEFELMSYRLNTHVKPLIWIESVIERHDHSRYQYPYHC
jgi:hypothetical protein